MNRVKGLMDKILSAVCALLLLFMTALATYQVASRYIFKNPSTMSEDLLSYSFVWVSLLGTALVFGQKDHMSLTLFSDKFTGKGKLALSVFTELLIISTAVVVFLFGGRIFMGVGALQMSPTLNIQMNWVYVILPVTGLLIIIYNIINIIHSIQEYTLSDKEELQ